MMFVALVVSIEALAIGAGAVLVVGQVIYRNSERDRRRRLLEKTR